MIDFTFISAACQTVLVGGPIAFNPACFLSLPTTIWFPIFLLIILVATSVIAVIFMLSPLLGRSDIRLWSRIKIYELLLTVVLGVIFLTMSTLLYTVDPTPALRSVGLLPTTCDPTVSGNVPSSLLITNNLYSVALCDMYQYNADVSSFSTGMFYFAMVAGLAPVIPITQTIDVGGPPALPTSGTGAAPAPGIGFNLDLQLIPIQVVLQYIVPLMGAYFAVVILAQVQQILLSAAMIIFSIFMAIGLCARAFSVTKTFGGSMIAFGLGIGFVYPLVTLISYGFLDVVISNATGNISVLLFLTNAATALIHGAYAILDASISGNGVCSNPISNSCQTVIYAHTGLAGVLTPFVVVGGFVSSGLLFIPLLNLVIVDAFIVDVSKVIGERIDLMSLLTRIV
jgi:hypothetical protein